MSSDQDFAVARLNALVGDFTPAALAQRLVYPVDYSGTNMALGREKHDAVYLACAVVFRRLP